MDIIVALETTQALIAAILIALVALGFLLWLEGALDASAEKTLKRDLTLIRVGLSKRGLVLWRRADGLWRLETAPGSYIGVQITRGPWQALRLAKRVVRRPDIYTIAYLHTRNDRK